MEYQGEIILYQPDEAVKLEVRLEDETVWLTQNKMAEFFQSTKQNISLHTNNIFKEKELIKDSVAKESLTTESDGKRYRTKYYCLDVIISVGYRVKSQRGTQFRQWANKVLKEYLLKGYSINQRISQLENKMDSRLAAHDRFLIVDDTVYHIGASLKDLGKKMFAFSKMEMPASTIISLL